MEPIGLSAPYTVTLKLPNIFGGSRFQLTVDMFKVIFPKI